jgi:predicted nucleic acid-binding Zn ribbon protein
VTGPEPPSGEPPHEGGPPADDWDPDGVDLARSLVARAKFPQRWRTGRQSRPGRRATKGNRGQGAGWSGPADDDRDPQSLEAAVERLVGEHGWGEDLAVHGVVARWDQIVGTEVAAHVRPERYADTVLTVRADSTAWATQVRLLAPTIVRRLNEEIGDGVVSKVTVLGPHTPSWRKGPRTVRGRGPRDTYG